jgi:hypothetical protein
MILLLIQKAELKLTLRTIVAKKKLNEKLKWKIENMSKSKFLLSFAAIFLGFISCKEGEKDISNSVNKIILSSISFDISFPDTVTVNKSYNGKVFCKSELDELTISFENVNISRYVAFMLHQTNHIKYDCAELSKRYIWGNQ